MVETTWEIQPADVHCTGRKIQACQESTLFSEMEEGGGHVRRWTIHQTKQSPFFFFYINNQYISEWFLIFKTKQQVKNDRQNDGN